MEQSGEKYWLQCGEKEDRNTIFGRKRSIYPRMASSQMGEES